MSKYHLLRAFREAVGLPPHAYVTHLRIARGKQLLRAGVSPADVAAALGFVDQSHFARHFRLQIGTSPSRFQKAMTQ
jgi:AraC-like DNA-binding protein